jgi:hypothetical protein
MSDTPKFEVIDRRKMKAEEEKEGAHTATQEPAKAAPAAPAATGEASPGPRLVVNDANREEAKGREDAKGAAATTEDAGSATEAELLDGLPPAPTAAESQEQKTAYDASAQRLEDLVRAQNPAAGPQPPMGFDQLVQQFYVTAMLQMGAGTQEGQRPRVDIMGARATIDLLGVLAEKTRGNLTPAEDRILQTVLFEARMAFMELTSMMSVTTAPQVPPVKK